MGVVPSKFWRKDLQLFLAKTCESKVILIYTRSQKNKTKQNVVIGRCILPTVENNKDIGQKQEILK